MERLEIMEESLKRIVLEKDIIGSKAALRRAAVKARDLAREKGTYIVIYHDGKILKKFV